MSNQKPRDLTIDVLRALSIVVMMIMHVNAYYLGDKVSLIFWSYSQWVVPAFVFCSFAVGKHEIKNIKEYMDFLGKRLKRIVIPYYIWLIFHVLLIWVVTQEFPTFDYIIKNILFTGGASFNWLVLLFIYLTVFGPIMYLGVFRKSIVGLTLLIPGIIMSIVIIFDQNYWSNGFRLSMLLPWISITTCLLFLQKLILEKKFRLIAILTAVFSFVFVFFFLNVILPLGMRHDLFFHKYPPNIYFVIFCIFTTPLAYFVSKVIANFVLMRSEKTAKAVQYISKNSYSIFFVHTLVLYVVEKMLLNKGITYQQFLLLLFVFTYLILFIIQSIPRMFIMKHR